MRIKAYKYRIYPNKNQEIRIAKHFGCVRWVYNWGLNSKIKGYQESGKSPSCFDLIKQVTQLKKQEETRWLSEVHSQSLQRSLINLDTAYTNFFRKKQNFPKFKSKKHQQSCQFTQQNRVDFDNGKIFVGKFRDGIRCKIDRRFIGTIKTVTISQSSSGKYFASVLVEEEGSNPKTTKLNKKRSMGIDLGIKDFVVTSKGDRFSNPKYLKRSKKQLKRLHRQHSKKQKGSKNREKSRIRLAKTYEKVSNQRKDFLHKITRQLINDNQVDTYCLETLSVKDMLKNHWMAKEIIDCGWFTFGQYLTYKAEWEGKHILRIGRFEPSSKMCNRCGIINNTLQLKDRVWICECGERHDRDYLAASNIRDFAFDKQNLIGLG